MELKLSPKMFDQLIDNLRQHVTEVRLLEKEIMFLCIKQAGMPRKDFISTFPKNETSTRWLDKHIKAKKRYSAPLAKFKDEVERRQNKLKDLEGPVPCADQRDQGDQPRGIHRRSQGAPREEGNGRGQPAPGDFHRQEIHQPRPAVPRSDPGRQHRLDEGRRQVRISPRLQVLDLCDLVDSPGHHALDRRPGAHHPHSGAHDRNDQQAEPHLAADAAGDGPRADAGRTGRAHGNARGQGPQGAEDRQGAHLDGDADRRRRGFALGRLHRGHLGVLADRLGDHRVAARDHALGARAADAARSQGAAHALRHRHEHRPHPRGSRQAVRCHARAHPADRSQGAAQAAPSEPQRAAAQLLDGRLRPPKAPVPRFSVLQHFQREVPFAVQRVATRQEVSAFSSSLRARSISAPAGTCSLAWVSKRVKRILPSTRSSVPRVRRLEAEPHELSRPPRWREIPARSNRRPRRSAALRATTDCRDRRTPWAAPIR